MKMISAIGSRPEMTKPKKRDLQRFVGRRIRVARKNAGLYQRELAESGGIPQPDHVRRAGGKRHGIHGDYRHCSRSWRQNNAAIAMNPCVASAQERRGGNRQALRRVPAGVVGWCHGTHNEVLRCAAFQAIADKS
jgi:hypothetical protein